MMMITFRGGLTARRGRGTLHRASKGTLREDIAYMTLG
jgi:hypothetical protein